MRIANPFRYMFRESYPSTGTIYKAWFGKKYLIWKAKSLHQSVNNMAKEIDQRLRLGLKEGDQYAKVVQYIRKGRITIFEVEAVEQSDNPVDLLIAEHKLLKAGESDPECLNVTFFPMMPGWVTDEAKAEFQQHLSKLAAASRKPAKKRGSAARRGKGQAKKVGRKTPANRSGVKKKSPFRKAKDHARKKVTTRNS